MDQNLLSWTSNLMSSFDPKRKQYEVSWKIKSVNQSSCSEF